MQFHTINISVFEKKFLNLIEVKSFIQTAQILCRKLKYNYEFW